MSAWERISGCKTVVWSRPGVDRSNNDQFEIVEVRVTLNTWRVVSGEARDAGTLTLESFTQLDIAGPAQ